MKTSFASAIGRALEETRAGHAAEATQILQDALATGAPGMARWEMVQPDFSLPRMRAPLGRVVDSLVNGKAIRARMPKGGGHPQPKLPEGATYHRRHHSSEHGSLAYTVFVPSKRQAPVCGLIVMLHGCTQNADDFAAGTQMNLHAERENILVAYPEQNRGTNQLGCWNWFEPKNQRRGGGEPALLADLAMTLAAKFSVSEGRTFAAGLSAGGAMAAILGAEYGDVFAGVGVHSGLAPGAARDVMSAYAAMNGQGHASVVTATSVPMFVIHGTADSTVHPGNAEKVLASAVGTVSTVIVGPGEGAQVALHMDGSGHVLAESWTVPGLGHAWSGGSQEGSYTAPGGVDASAEMMRFFLKLVGEDPSCLAA
jgi:poly(hydroxyalkanoate) depolymerase family esterase